MIARENRVHTKGLRMEPFLLLCLLLILPLQTTRAGNEEVDRRIDVTFKNPTWLHTLEVGLINTTFKLKKRNKRCDYIDHYVKLYHDYVFKKKDPTFNKISKELPKVLKKKKALFHQINPKYRSLKEVKYYRDSFEKAFVLKDELSPYWSVKTLNHVLDFEYFQERFDIETPPHIKRGMNHEDYFNISETLTLLKLASMIKIKSKEMFYDVRDRLEDEYYESGSKGIAQKVVKETVSYTKDVCKDTVSAIMTESNYPIVPLEELGDKVNLKKIIQKHCPKDPFYPLTCRMLKSQLKNKKK